MIWSNIQLKDQEIKLFLIRTAIHNFKHLLKVSGKVTAKIFSKKGFQIFYVKEKRYKFSWLNISMGEVMYRIRFNIFPVKEIKKNKNSRKN